MRRDAGLNLIELIITVYILLFVVTLSLAVTLRSWIPVAVLAVGLGIYWTQARIRSAREEKERARKRQEMLDRLLDLFQRAPELSPDDLPSIRAGFPGHFNTQSEWPVLKEAFPKEIGPGRDITLLVLLDLTVYGWHPGLAEEIDRELPRLKEALEAVAHFYHRCSDQKNAIRMYRRILQAGGDGRTVAHCLITFPASDDTEWEKEIRMHRELLLEHRDGMTEYSRGLLDKRLKNWGDA